MDRSLIYGLAIVGSFVAIEKIIHLIFPHPRNRYVHKFQHNFYYHFQTKELALKELPNSITLASQATAAVARASEGKPSQDD